MKQIATFGRIGWLFYPLCLLLLLACSQQEEYDASSLSTLRIRAEIDPGAWNSTRAGEVDDATKSGAMKSAFGNGDAIGVTVSEGSNLKYTCQEASSEGASSTWSADDNTVVYFTDIYKEISAYYPYSERGDEAYEDVEPQDFLATGKVRATVFTQNISTSADGSTSAADVTLTFKHVMSRLTFKVVMEDSEVTAITPSGCSLSGLVTTGTFTPSTGVAEATSGATAPTQDNYDLLTPQIIFPQTASPVVAFTYNKKNYQAQIGEVKFEGGKSYTYTLKVKSSGESGSGSGDNNGGDNSSGGDNNGGNTEVVVEGVITELALVRKYDCALSTGGFVRPSTDAYTNNKSNIVGVVFWTKAQAAEGDADLSDDPVIQTDYPSCTHGLIAYKESYGTSVVWTSSAPTATITSYLTQLTDYSYLSLTNQDKLQGLNNTCAMRAYNKLTGITSTVTLVQTLDEQEYTKLENCTPWYIPSYKELQLFLDDYQDSSSALRSDLKVGGTTWSSTEGSDVAKAYKHANSSTTINTQNKTSTARLHAICAF